MAREDLHVSAKVMLHKVGVQQLISCTNVPHYGSEHGKFSPHEFAKKNPRVTWAQDIIIIGTPEKPIIHGDDTPMKKNDWACMESMKMEFPNALEKESFERNKDRQEQPQRLVSATGASPTGHGKTGFSWLSYPGRNGTLRGPCLEGVAWRPAREDTNANFIKETFPSRKIISGSTVENAHKTSSKE